MPSNVFEMLASLVVANFAGVEFFVVFDSLMNKLYSISAIDVIKKQFDNITPINRVSEIKSLGRVKFIGLKDFLTKYPESNIDAYVQASHKQSVLDNYDSYIASYVHLYRVYKSLSTLMGRKYVNLIDTFIDYCMSEGTDHPATLSYSAGEIHKVLKFRKATYTAIKKYLTSHDSYLFFQKLNKNKYTDKQFREVRNIIKDCVKKHAITVDEFINALDVVSAENKALEGSVTNKSAKTSDKAVVEKVLSHIMSKRDIYEALELSDLPELRGPEALGEDLELPPIVVGDRSAA